MGVVLVVVVGGLGTGSHSAGKRNELIPRTQQDFGKSIPGRGKDECKGPGDRNKPRSGLLKAATMRGLPSEERVGPEYLILRVRGPSRVFEAGVRASTSR